jgi:U3 small nucleolar RNA-associated protein 22
MQGPTFVISKKFARISQARVTSQHFTQSTAAMAPPVTKRRKLEHSDSEEESEGSFAGFDEIDDAASDASAGAEDGVDESDVEMSGADDLEDLRDLQDGSKEEDGSEDEDADETPAPAVKATTLSKPTKRPASSLQDGVYTAESFKSNMFKLQVDELLQQVRLKYRKKEATAENAMRTLKTMIEQIPSRDALPVCIKYHPDHSRLTNYRYPKPRSRSNRLV